MRSILGIDPGLGGACAIFRPESSAASGLRWAVIDMPVVGEPPFLNATALRDWLRKFAPDACVIEQVNAMPSIPGKDGVRRGMGATSAFRFGGVYYAAMAVVSCCDIPIVEKAPSVRWKKLFGLKGSDKERSRLKAIELFPEAAALLARKKDENRAEAMLIAAYGSKIVLPTGPEIPRKRTAAASPVDLADTPA